MPTPSPEELAAFEECFELVERFGTRAKETGVVGMTMVVDPSDGQARCEFVASDAQLVGLMTAAWCSAILLIPDDRKMAFMEEVLGRVSFGLFDPRGELYRPYGSDRQPGQGEPS